MQGREADHVLVLDALRHLVEERRRVSSKTAQLPSSKDG